MCFPRKTRPDKTMRCTAFRRLARDAFVLVTVFAALANARILQDSTLGLSEVDWHLEKELIFLGSPSIVRAPDDVGGHLLASHDYFGSGMHFRGLDDYVVSVFASSDNGTTWAFQANVTRMYWANLFVHGNEVYLMGTASDDGGVGHNVSHVVISRSEDGGRTWSEAAILFHGPYHTAPTPIMVLGNRIYRAMEYWAPPGRYGIDYEAVVLSCPVACTDLRNASCWDISSTLRFDRSWIPKEWGNVTDPSWQEGNAVETPDGESIVNILRVNAPPAVNKAAMVAYDKATRKLSFSKFISFPGGHTKFVIRRHPTSREYYTLSNNVTDAKYGGMRNVLTLSKSSDLVEWTVCVRLLEDDTGFTFADSVRFTGFHYVDWHFSGQDNTDMIYLIRTSYRGANTFHNSNRITYKHLENFQKLCTKV